MGNPWSSKRSDQKKESKLSTNLSPRAKLPLPHEQKLISNTLIKESRSSSKKDDSVQPCEEALSVQWRVNQVGSCPSENIVAEQKVPQWILDSLIESGRGSLCEIISTQPRRISAIGLKSSESAPNEFIFEHSDHYTADYYQYLKNSKLHETGITTEDKKCYPIFRDIELDNQFEIEMQKQRLRKDYQRMLSQRQTLPAYNRRKEIIDLIEKNQVIVLVGETGCGKTTQVPQYILDSFIESGRGSLCKIICTQPRRISAIGVAQRVAAERCVSCGGLGAVGYQIRLDWYLLDKKIICYILYTLRDSENETPPCYFNGSKKPRDFGSILFCTTGILLVQLQNNPFLSGISHVIVDEVHERDQLSDFLLMCLRDILKKNTNLKVILMSATVNAKEFSSYFGNCPTINIPGFTFSVTPYYLEDILKFTGYKPKMQNKYQWKKATKQSRDPQYEESKDFFYQGLIIHRFPEDVIRTLRNWNEDILDLNLIAELLKYICSKQSAGTILVFLPGWHEITKLHNLIVKDFPRHKYMIILLHSKTADQCEKKVLNRAPDGIRKIILATNMAETSITIDDCTVVIDSGRFKQSSFDPLENMHILKTQWAAMSNVKQRRGRAGRTQPGESYHMFTSLEEIFLEPYQVPEMQRCSLEQLILNIKILKQCKVRPYLQTALSPPLPEAVEVSLQHLHELHALTPAEILTPLGFLLAKLPVDIHVGKMLLYGAIFSCLDPITSIAACLSFKDPFTCSVWAQKESKDRKLELADHDQSDHMLFVNVLKEWSELEGDADEIRTFCRQNFVSDSTLRMLMELKQQFARYLKQLNFLKEGDAFRFDNNVNSGNKFLIKSIIGAALYPNIVEVENHGHGPLSAKTKDGKMVYVHPKSINSFQNYINTGWLAYHMKVKSTKVYIHDTTDIQLYNSLLLGGNKIDPVRDKKSLKYQLDDILEKKFLKPSHTNWFDQSNEIRTLERVVIFITQSYL